MNATTRPGDVGFCSPNRVPVVPAARPGDPDLSFGNNGLVTRLSSGFGIPTGDGKYWLITRRESSHQTIEVRRLLDDGSNDPTFPEDGTSFDLYPGATDFQIFNARTQTDGKIVIGGRVFPPDESGGIPIYARIGLDGLPDDSFGDKGIKLIDFDKDEDEGVRERYVYDLCILHNKAIVASTLSLRNGRGFPRLIRLLEDGTQDVGFGQNGVVYFPSGTIVDAVTGLEDGKLLVAGSSEDDRLAFVMRLLADGTTDREFGHEGIVRFKSSDGSDLWAHAMAVRPQDGSVVVGGLAYPGGWITRISPDGELDAGFNRGILLTGDVAVSSLAIQGDGKVLIHGMLRTSSNSYLTLARVEEHGSLDPTFGIGGIVVAPPPVSSPASIGFSQSVIQGQKLFLTDVTNVDDGFRTQLLRYLIE